MLRIKYFSEPRKIPILRFWRRCDGRWPDEILFRPGSYVAFLPCRIQFNELSAAEIRRLNRLPHVRLGLSHHPAEIRYRCKRRISATSNFCRVESNADIMLMYWACVDWGWLSKMASWRASCERQTSESSSYVTFVTLTDIHRCINSVQKFDVWISSRISAALNWIEFDTGLSS